MPWTITCEPKLTVAPLWKLEPVTWTRSCWFRLPLLGLQPVTTGAEPGGGGGELTVVVALAVLLAVLGSLCVALTLALLAMGPALFGVTVIVNVAVPPLPSVPAAQVRVPDPEQPGAETRVTLPGSVSVTTTFVAVSGPLLVTAMV